MQPLRSNRRSTAANDRLMVALRSLSARPVPIGRWRDEVLSLYGPSMRARSTRARMSQALAIVTSLGPRKTSELTPALLARFVAETLPGRRAETVNGLLRALRRACNYAVQMGWLSVSPFDLGTFWAPPDSDGRSRHHSRKDVARVLASLGRDRSWEGARLHCLASVLAYCGLRKMEAIRLRVEDVDLAGGFVFIRRRGGRLKTASSAAPVPIPDALRPVLARWLRRCGSEWLFPGVKGQGPWTGGSAGQRAGDRLRLAAEAVGIRGFTPQSLRHSLATHLAGVGGLTGAQLRMVLRHTNEFTQAHYVHPDLANLRELVAGFRYSA